MKIVEASTAEQLDAVRTLFRAYGEFLANGEVQIHLQGLEEEIAALPGPHAPPSGALLLAKDDAGASFGCAALKKVTLADGETACEIKRLYVAPTYRGSGAGRGLMEAAIQWAGDNGCASVVLDTQPEKMREAVRFYRALGFRQIERYNTNPVPDIEFYRLAL